MTFHLAYEWINFLIIIESNCNLMCHYEVPSLSSNLTLSYEYITC